MHRTPEVRDVIKTERNGDEFVVVAVDLPNVILYNLETSLKTSIRLNLTGDDITAIPVKTLILLEQMKAKQFKTLINSGVKK